MHYISSSTQEPHSVLGDNRHLLNSLFLLPCAEWEEGEESGQLTLSLSDVPFIQRNVCLNYPWVKLLHMKA